MHIEDISLDFNQNKVVAFLSKDDSASHALEKIVKQIRATDKPYMVQYVPDDIVCYSNLTVAEFLQVMTGGKEEVAEEAARLLSVFQIQADELLLDMTFEQNRLVAMISSMMWKPDVLLLDHPEDMLSEEVYMQLLKEVVHLYQRGCRIVIATGEYKDLLLTCYDYVFMEEDQVIGRYGREELPRPAKVITLWSGKTDSFVADKMTMLIQRKGYCRFLYEEKDMKELGVRLALSGAKNYMVEELSMEEMLFGNYERWKS